MQVLGGGNMLYALIDSSTKYNFNKISSEEILGEVKVVTPKFNKKNTKKMTKKVLQKLAEYKVENVVLSEELMANEEFCKELEESKNILLQVEELKK